MNIQEIANELNREIIKNIFSKLDDEEKYVILELNNQLQDKINKIDKANELLSKIVVRKREDGNWCAVKNTRKQDVYKTIWKLYEILDTSSYERNEMLKIFGDKE